jgi:hypothetical protein
MYRPLGPLSFLYNWYRVSFPGVKRTERGMGKRKSRAIPVLPLSWPRLGRTLLLLYNIAQNILQLHTFVKTSCVQPRRFNRANTWMQYRVRRFSGLWYTRWFKYDREKLWLVYTQIVPVIFEPPCILRIANGCIKIYNECIVPTCPHWLRACSPLTLCKEHMVPVEHQLAESQGVFEGCRERKIFCRCWKSKDDSSVVQPIN